MTDKIKSSVDFLQSLFSPKILVLATEDVEKISARNGLTFAELLSPFASVQASTYLKDPLNQTVNIDLVRLKFADESDNTPDPGVVKRVLGDAVSNYSGFEDCDDVYSNASVSPAAETPWFESWRGLFFDVVPPGEHEFLDHVVGFLFVLSERDAPHESVSLLYKRLHHEMKVKSFFNTSLNHYVVVHDASSGDLAVAEKKCEMLRSHHGYAAANIIKLNSLKENETGGPPVELWSPLIARKKAFERTKPKKWVQTPVEEEEIGGSLPCIDATTLSGLSSGLSSPPEYATEASAMSDSRESSNPNFQAVTIHPLSPDAPVSQFPGAPAEANHAPGIIVVNEDNLPAPGAGDGFDDDCNHFGDAGLGKFLSVADLESVRAFLKHYVCKALIPYVERQLKLLHETVGSRKGIHRSIVTATKKWFAPAAKTTPGPNSNTVLYGQDAPELQVRKLADLCFLFRHYDLAYQAYHNAKREYDSDQAWIHMAGAMEMAAVAAFLHSTLQAIGQGGITVDTYKQLPQRYFDMAINSYLNVCRLPDYAARTALFSTECLKARGLWGEAALAYIRLSGEDSDLRSALFLEQAALCFLKCSPPGLRKFGFHMVLAGHRFYKCGQKRHTIRAYCQALQVYRLKGWQLAEDHINYTIGRQARCLNQMAVALQALTSLITKTCGQKSTQEGAFLREFILTFKRSVEEGVGLPGSSVKNDLYELPLPVIDGNRSQLLVPGSLPRDEQFCGYPAIHATNVSFNDELSNENVWVRLEELAVEDATKEGSFTPVMVFQPSLQRFCDGTSNTIPPAAFIDEPVFVEILLSNPLQVSMMMTEVKLLCDFAKNGGETNDLVSGDESGCVRSQVVPSMIIEPLSETKLHLSLMATSEGQLTISGLAYKLRCHGSEGESSSEEIPEQTDVVIAFGRQDLNVKGPRLSGSKQERCSVVYGVDKRFTLQVFSPRPLLECRLLGVPIRMLRNEIRCCVLCLRNVGSVALSRISMSFKDPQCFVVGQASKGRIFGSDESEEEIKTYVDSWLSSSIVGRPEDEGEDVSGVETVDGVTVDVEKKATTKHFVSGSLIGSVLPIGCHYLVPLWVKAPSVTGWWASQVLFHYEADGMSDGKKKRRHRVLRHTFEIEVLPSLSFFGSAHRCPRLVHNEENGLVEKADSFNVILEAKNDCRAPDSWREVTLAQFSAVSGSVAMKKKEMKQKVILKPQERHHFFLEVDKFGREYKLCGDTNEESLRISSVYLTEKTFNPGCTPLKDFVKRSAWPVLKDEVLRPVYPDRSASSLSGGPGIPGEFEGSPAVLAPMSFRGPRITHPEDESASRGPNPLLRMFCLWKCDMKELDGTDRVAWGVSSAALYVREKDGVVEACPRDMVRFLDINADFANLMKCRYTYALDHRHDFDRHRICVVDLNLHVQNCSPFEVSLVIDASNETARYSGQAGVDHSGLMLLPRPSSPFVLVGRRFKRNIRLAPGAISDPVDLKAAFTRPGAYNLASLPPILGISFVRGESVEEEPRWIRAAIPESLLVIESL